MFFNKGEYKGEPIGIERFSDGFKEMYRVYVIRKGKKRYVKSAKRLFKGTTTFPFEVGSRLDAEKRVKLIKDGFIDLDGWHTGKAVILEDTIK